jgi:hypothetical protein
VIEGERNFVLQRVLVPRENSAVLAQVTVAEQSLLGGLAEVAAAFRRNLQAVISTAAVPFWLASAGVQRLRWQQLAIAEKIRAQTLVEDGTPEDEAERIAQGIARERLAAELRSEPKIFGDRTLDSLRGALEEKVFEEGASELLRQCTVLVWSALEVLAQEVFTEILNAKPMLATRLYEGEATKKLFPWKSIMFDDLVRHDFDLSRKMGQVLLELRAIDTIPLMRAVFAALFPGADDLREAFGDKSLWILNQRRHLIVHKRGVVDRDYLNKTGADIQLGQQLTVTTSDLEQHMDAVIVVGSELLIYASSA